jgi:hypothetical protein
VVATIVPVLVAALEMSTGADQHRRAAFGDHVVDLGEFVVVRAGEFVRQVDLIVRRNASLLKGHQMLEVAEADLEHGFVHPQACRKSLAERVDANDGAFRASR